MAWYNSDWKYRAKITVKASKVTSTLTNFPVFVDLSNLSPSFHENVKSDGGDIRITSSDETTELAREVVFYDRATSSGELHFKAPSISSSVNTDFYVYYGNSAASDHSAASTYGSYNVWTTSTAVYHLNEAANTTSNGYKNARANTAHGTGTSMGLPSIEGKLGKAAELDGIDDRILISSAHSLTNANVTLSGWVYIASESSKGTFFGVGTNTTGYAIGVGNTTFDDVGNKLIILYSAVRWVVTSATLSVGWHYVALTINGSGVPSAWLDGVLVGAYSGTNAVTPVSYTGIGYQPVSVSRHFGGGVDEYRIYNAVRTAAWFAAEYENQNTPTDFFIFSTQEKLVGDTPQEQIGSTIATESLDIPEYTVELWSSTGVYMADVSNILVSGLSIDIPLNDVEQVDFSLDLIQFEEKCARIGATPKNVLDPYRTEVKIKRNGAYLLGTQVVQAEVNLNNESANTIEVRTTGYLNLFKDRYITPGVAPASNAGVYANKTYAQLAQRLILDTQYQTNGDFGVRIGSDTASEAQNPGRTRQGDYDNQNVKDGIINLTKLEADNFDFKFTWDKKFNVYERLGSDKPDIELVYPFNVVSMKILRDASTLANKIIGLGSGLGDERLSHTEIDSTSASTYVIREKIELFNSVNNQNTLESNVQGLIPIYKDMYESPVVELTNGAVIPGEVWVGDAVLVRVEGSSFIETIDDMYRITNMRIRVTNDLEENISLKLVRRS